jgi:toxin ParE1/3/4
MAEYRLSPKAQADLDGIFDYSLSKWGLEQALRYSELIEAACTALAKSPLHAQSCSHVRPGYRRRIVEQHMIYFRQAPYGIAVIRILHHKMDALRHL